MIGDHVDKVDEVKKEEEKKGCETKMTEEDKETTEEGISSTAKKNIHFILGGQQQDSTLTCERKHSDPFGLTTSQAFAAQPASTSSPSPNSTSSGCQLVKDNVSKSASSITSG